MFTQSWRYREKCRAINRFTGPFIFQPDQKKKDLTSIQRRAVEAVSPPVCTEVAALYKCVPLWSGKWDQMWKRWSGKETNGRPHITALRAVDRRSPCSSSSSSSTAESKPHLNTTTSGQSAERRHHRKHIQPNTYMEYMNYSTVFFSNSCMLFFKYVPSAGPAHKNDSPIMSVVCVWV